MTYVLPLPALALLPGTAHAGASWHMLQSDGSERSYDATRLIWRFFRAHSR